MYLSIGKLRGLQQLADTRGLLTMCAIDHRGALQRALNESDPKSVSYQDMVDFKLDLCKAVSDVASAVLLDPEFGAGQAIAAGVLPGRVGLLVSMEKTGYSSTNDGRETQLLPGWGVRKAKRMGASAVKLLVYFRPDLKDLASRQLDLVARLADQCVEEDIPLLVEPVSYPVEKAGETAEKFSQLKPDLVIETARQITDLPIDVLKAEFPADMKYEQNNENMLEYCRELDKASKKPWVILSAGVDFVSFRKQVEIACMAGASGFLAGRALWQESVALGSRGKMMEFFETTAAARLKEIADIADTRGTPWYAKLDSEHGEFEAVGGDWYKDY